MTSEFHSLLDRLVAAASEAEVYEVGAELVSELSNAHALIYSLTGGDELEIRSTTVPSIEETYRSIPLSDHILSHTAQLARPARIDDCADTRSAVTAETEDATARPYRSVLLVPIPDRGMVVAADEAPGVFDDEDLARAERAARLVELKLHEVANPAGASIAEDRLETIASVLSHDLGSPLTVARGYVQDAIDRDETENLENVLLALERIEEITGGLAEFARTGQAVTEPRPVELRETAETSWSMVETGNATLETPSSETILADEHAFYQLFENLFANAIQHGGEDVTVRVGAFDGSVGFFVEDDGPGIPPEKREMVFEHGYSGTDEHSGFGLSIVRGIVEGHGWEIRVVEGEDGGARFEVTGIRVE